MSVKTFTHSPASHSQEMLGKLNMLWNDAHFCGITKHVQENISRAHEVVLAACSDFFRSELVGQAEDENKNMLALHHVTVTGFIALLEYAYTATVSINAKNIIDILVIANYMQMFSVASIYLEFMKSSIFFWNIPNTQPEKGLDRKIIQLQFFFSKWKYFSSVFRVRGGRKNNSFLLGVPEKAYKLYSYAS